MRVRDGRLGQILAGRYRLEEPVGVGASGRVYAAHDLRLARPVAVKILDDALAADPIFVDRFHREVRTASQLSHPHVVRVFDWGDDPGPYLVTELVGGGSLAALLARGVRLSPAQAVHMGHDVAEALAEAHAQGIVHRDVKPANLLFDERGEVRLADFGLARAMASASPTARRDAVFGTLRYAAPEQVGRDGADPRSDLYALALVLVEAVTGEVPFDADDPATLIAARRERPIPIPATLGPLAEVIDRTGRVRPDDRLPDAAAMARLLAQVARRLPEPEPIPVALVSLGHLDHLDSHIDIDLDLDLERHRFDLDGLLLGGGNGHDPRRMLQAEHRRRAEPVDPYPTELAPSWYATGVAAAGDESAPWPGRPTPIEAHGDRADRRPTSQRRARRTSRRSVREQRGQRRSLLDRILAPMMVSLLVVVAALVVLIATTKADTDDAPRFPNTVGGSIDDARQALGAAGLDPEQASIERRFSHEAEGTVVGQSPSPGLAVSDDTPVTFLISAGPEMTSVPELGAVDEATARSLLEGARLVVGTVGSEHNEFLAAGLLISQNPAAGASLEVASVVDLVFSLGPTPRSVPSLTGLTVDEVRAALAAADLVLSEPPGQEYSEDVEIGRVIRQDLVPGSLTDRGHLVNVMVSLGPELVPVPALSGLTVEDATSQLRAVGLEVGTAFNYSPGGKVLDSDPPAGTQLRKGTEVDLFVRR